MSKRLDERDKANVDRTIEWINKEDKLPIVDEEANGLYCVTYPGMTYWVRTGPGFTYLKEEMEKVGIQLVEEEKDEE